MIGRAATDLRRALKHQFLRAIAVLRRGLVGICDHRGERRVRRAAIDGQRAGEHQKWPVRRRGKAASKRDAGHQIGIQAEIQVSLAFAAGGAGEVKDSICTGKQLRLPGHQCAKVAFHPFGACRSGPVVRHHLINQDQPLDNVIGVVQAHRGANRHGGGKTAADEAVGPGDQNLCHGEFRPYKSFRANLPAQFCGSRQRRSAPANLR